MVRFCRSLGYDGLKDFKFKLEGSMNEGVLFVHRSNASRPIIESAVTALVDTYRSGRRIEIFGLITT